jgi:hypothetical protein
LNSVPYHQGTAGITISGTCVCVCVWARGEVAVGLKTSHQNEIHYIRNATQDIGINHRIPQNFGDMFIIRLITVFKSGTIFPRSSTDYRKETRFKGVDLIQLTRDWPSCDICENGNDRLHKRLSISR